MPAGGCSVFTDDHVVCRVRVPFTMHRGRRLARTGQFKGLISLTPADALDLVRRDVVKLPAGVSQGMLRDAVAANIT